MTTLAKAKAKTNETFIGYASLTIVTYDRQNMFIVQATERFDQIADPTFSDREEGRPVRHGRQDFRLPRGARLARPNCRSQQRKIS